jgi:hypothetical protein
MIQQRLKVRNDKGIISAINPQITLIDNIDCYSLKENKII